MTVTKQFDGSRRHVLDFVEKAEFLDTVRAWVREQGLTIPQNTLWMPKSWTQPTESRLFDASSPFLTENEKAVLRKWWLVHSGNVPNWDLVVAGLSEDGGRALVLVEAKAYSGEFNCGPKPPPNRKPPDAQCRSLKNHEQIQRAIDEAGLALSKWQLDISISLDLCYQLANRLATAWKLATLGIPSTLVFLGFTGDTEIGTRETYFADDSHWQRAFEAYSASCFSPELLDRDIPCGKASFRVIARSVPVVRLSRPIAERRVR